jgi:hypothetical protein
MEKNRRLASAEEVRRYQDSISVLGVRGDFDFLAKRPFLKEAKPPDKNSELKSGQKPPPRSNLEEFFKNLKLSYPDDLEIEIQIPGRKLRVTPNMLGCRNEKTQQWIELCKIIKHPEHKMNVGASGRTEQEKRYYGARLKVRDEINKKLVKYFRTLNKNIPEKIKLYYQDSTDPPGEFRFRLGGIDNKKNSRFSKMSNEELLNKINSGYRYDETESLEATQEALRRGISNEEIIRATRASEEIIRAEEIKKEFKKPEFENLPEEDYYKKLKKDN